MQSYKPLSKVTNEKILYFLITISTYILSAFGPYFANWTVISRPSTTRPKNIKEHASIWQPNESFIYKRITFIKKNKHSYHPASPLPSAPHLHTCTAQMQNHANHQSFTIPNNNIICSQLSDQQNVLNRLIISKHLENSDSYQVVTTGYQDYQSKFNKHQTS